MSITFSVPSVNHLISISFVKSFRLAARGLTWCLEKVSGEFVSHVDVAGLGHLEDEAQHEAVHAAEVVDVGRVHEFLVELDGWAGRGKGQQL